MNSDWINLSEAAELLGVHPATLRAWGDKGEFPMQRTPGGHRRFRRSDVAARAVAPDRPHQSSYQLVLQNMVGRARLELTDGALKNEAWYRHIDKLARRELSQIGHRLLQLLLKTFTRETPAPAAKAEAEAIGQAYEELGRQSGLTLEETLRAYLFFRGFLSQTVYDMAETVGTQGSINWGQIHQSISSLMDDVLLSLIAAHEGHLNGN